MTLLFARTGSDLRQIHSRSIHKIDVVVPAHSGRGFPLQGLVRAVRQRFIEARRARAVRRELESLGDTALADLGIPRSEIPGHVARAMRRHRLPRIQSVRGLSGHLLADLGLSVSYGDTRVYTSVPLGVVTGPASGTVPANTEQARKIA